MKILFVLFIFYSVGVAQEINEELPPFSRIDFEINAKTQIEFGDKFHLEINGDKRDIENITFEVRNNKLEIEYKDKGGLFSFFDSNDYEDVSVRIVMKSLESLRIKGSGKMDIDEFDNDRTEIIVNGATDLRTGGRIDEFDLEVNGAGDIRLQGLLCKEFDLSIKGAGDLKIDGHSERMNIDIKGAGDVRAYGFKVQYFTCRIYGAGDVQIDVEKELEASIYGAGSITYSGSPKKIKDKIYGAGDISRR